jgi:hypothetical protein
MCIHISICSIDKQAVRGKLFPKQLFIDWGISANIGIVLKSIVIVNKVTVFLSKGCYT